MKRTVTRFAAATAAVVATAAVTTASAGAADPGLPAFSGEYPVTGTGLIKKSNVTVPLGPTKLAVDVYENPDNVNELRFNGTLPLPAKNLVFKAFGYLPVRATITLTQVGKIPGTATFDPDAQTTTVQGQAMYDLKLSNVIIGYTKANVGANCRTVAPIQADVVSGPGFNLFTGGDLLSTFDIGQLGNCRTSTNLLNLIVPGPGNTLTADVGGFQAGSTNTATTRKVQQRFAVR